MAFLVLAFPIINKNDFEWIQSCRKENDKLQYGLVNPHFTIVFPVTDMAENSFVDEVILQSKNLTPITFEINQAIVNKDAFSNCYYEFLVPGKGNDEIVYIHDKLYSNALLPNLRNEIEFIPHLTIGCSESRVDSQQKMDHLKILSISGRIEELTIVNYQQEVVSKIIDIKLC